MTKKKPRAKARTEARFAFKLFLTGATARSQRALANIQRFCQTALPGEYDLEVIDIYQQPELAGKEQILASPTLIKTSPAPLRRLIGDMSDEKKVRVSLGLQSYGA